MMQSKKEHENLGREKLQRIIDTCKSVEDRALDPFLVDIKGNINALKEYFPEWSIPEDLCLDAETVHHLASVTRLQSEWVKHRSTSLYTDPFLLEDKIRRMAKADIVETFAKVWRPTIELEQISLHSITEAIEYWDSLLPMKERWKEFPLGENETGTATREELISQRILRDRSFSEELETFWQQLKKSTAEKGENGKIHYWNFVGADTYNETVQKAFMASFLITYGYATLEIHPLEEEVFIVPYQKPVPNTGSKQLVSIPIAVSAEDWQKWKKGELQ
jgi:hypothetical protein